MKSLTTLITVAATAATSTAASTTLFKNFCLESIFLTLNNEGPYAINSGQAFTASIVGQGNTALVTKNDDPFNAATAKMVLGTSTDLGVLYWYVSLSTSNL